jgi:PAS domain S-box-containing protein
MYNFQEIIKYIDRSNQTELAIQEYIQQKTNHELNENDIAILNKLLKHLHDFHPKPIIAETDLQGNIIYVNDEFLNITKYSRDEIIGENIRILRSGHVPTGVYQNLWSTISLGKAWIGELKNRTKDYENYWVSIFIAPIFNSDNQIVNYWSVAFDITERVKQKEAIEQKQNDIMESLRYAKRIQRTILPDKKAMDEVFDSYFVNFKPKDVVSGDFYWFNQVVDKAFVAVVDCTGHGVPGAFMSLIGYNLLNQIVIQKGIHEPGQILTELHNQVRATLKQDAADSKSRDGMDVCLVAVCKYVNKFEYAGANRPLLILKGDEIIEIKPTKYAIGGEQMDEERSYQNHEFKYEPGDTIYMFSDGFVDQFGGPEFKKFSTKRLKEIILANRHESLSTQRALFNIVWKDWKGDDEQTDDATMVAIRF